MSDDYKPYSILDADTKYFSGTPEEGPFKSARKVLKALERDNPFVSVITLTVQYIPAGADGEGSYWATTGVAAE